ncbi:MAG TPA: crosslink repair DNA glycosylase YcaQ family protein, partial [Thermaerobacter sp.]
MSGSEQGPVVRVSRQAAANYLLHRLGLLELAAPGEPEAAGGGGGVGPAAGAGPAPARVVTHGEGAGPEATSEAAPVTAATARDARSRRGRRREVPPPGVRAVLNRLGAVQLDPVNVVERNHHLVFFNRLRGYRPAWLEELYQRGQVFEAWCHARCVLPVAWYPAFRPAFRCDPDARLDPAVRAWMKRILDMVAAGGPVSPRRIESGERVIG